MLRDSVFDSFIVPANFQKEDTLTPIKEIDFVLREIEDISQKAILGGIENSLSRLLTIYVSTIKSKGKKEADKLLDRDWFSANTKAALVYLWENTLGVAVYHSKKEVEKLSRRNTSFSSDSLDFGLAEFADADDFLKEQKAASRQAKKVGRIRDQLTQNTNALERLQPQLDTINENLASAKNPAKRDQYIRAKKVLEEGISNRTKENSQLVDQLVNAQREPVTLSKTRKSSNSRKQSSNSSEADRSMDQTDRAKEGDTQRIKKERLAGRRRFALDKQTKYKDEKDPDSFRQKDRAIIQELRRVVKKHRTSVETNTPTPDFVNITAFGDTYLNERQDVLAKEVNNGLLANLRGAVGRFFGKELSPNVAQNREERLVEGIRGELVKGNSTASKEKLEARIRRIRELQAENKGESAIGQAASDSESPEVQEILEELRYSEKELRNAIAAKNKDAILEWREEVDYYKEELKRAGGSNTAAPTASISIGKEDQELLGTSKSKLTTKELNALLNKANTDRRSVNKDALREVNTRTKRIVLTEVSAAYNIGRLKYYLDNNVEYVRWRLDREHITRVPSTKSKKYKQGVVCPACFQRSVGGIDASGIYSIEAVWGDMARSKKKARIDYRFLKDSTELVIPLHPSCGCFFEPYQLTDEQKKRLGKKGLKGVFSSSAFAWAVGGGSVLAVSALYFALLRTGNAKEAARKIIARTRTANPLKSLKKLVQETRDTINPPGTPLSKRIAIPELNPQVPLDSPRGVPISIEDLITSRTVEAIPVSQTLLDIAVEKTAKIAINKSNLPANVSEVSEELGQLPEDSSKAPKTLPRIVGEVSEGLLAEIQTLTKDLSSWQGTVEDFNFTALSQGTEDALMQEDITGLNSLLETAGKEINKANRVYSQNKDLLGKVRIAKLNLQRELGSLGLDILTNEEMLSLNSLEQELLAPANELQNTVATLSAKRNKIQDYLSTHLEEQRNFLLNKKTNPLTAFQKDLNKIKELDAYQRDTRFIGTDLREAVATSEFSADYYNYYSKGEGASRITQLNKTSRKVDAVVQKYFGQITPLIGLNEVADEVASKYRSIIQSQVQLNTAKENLEIIGSKPSYKQKTTQRIDSTLGDKEVISRERQYFSIAELRTGVSKVDAVRRRQEMLILLDDIRKGEGSSTVRGNSNAAKKLKALVEESLEGITPKDYEKPPQKLLDLINGSEITLPNGKKQKLPGLVASLNAQIRQLQYGEFRRIEKDGNTVNFNIEDTHTKHYVYELLRRYRRV